MSDFDELFQILVRTPKLSAKGKQRLRFKGSGYILIGSKDYGGAIATVEQYEAGKCSFAHLFEDGRVLQFGRQIGTKDDIEWLP